jgi:hypothetical protein
MAQSAKRLAKAMTEAITRAVEADPGVQAIRRRAREAGLEMRVTLDATIRFGGQSTEAEDPLRVAASSPSRSSLTDLSESDRRFLRSLRIAPPAPINFD